MKRKLVFATNNPHKLEEAKQIVGNDVEILSLSDLGCHEEIPETAETLEGNALIKARWINGKYGVDCFADDTGLEVEALGNAPGVYSARYAGVNCTSSQNIDKLLNELLNADNRTACFRTAVALINDGKESVFEGRVEGSISRLRRGDSGFGYDSVFIENSSGKTFAEMSSDEKNAVSHRARALEKLKRFIISLCIISAVVLCYSGKGFAQDWRIHPAFDGQVLRTLSTPGATYFLGTGVSYQRGHVQLGSLFGSLLCFDEKNGSVVALDSSNSALSGTCPVAAEYNHDKGYLAVGYSDGDIDLVYDDGSVKNISALKIADNIAGKRINSISFNAPENEVYVATQFGFLVIDDVKASVKTSRIFQKDVWSAARWKERILIGLADGIYEGKLSASSISDYEKVAECRPTVRMIPWGEYLITVHDQGGRDVCNRGVIRDGKFKLLGVSFREEMSVERGKDVVVVTGREGVRMFDKNWRETAIALPAQLQGSVSGSYDGRTFWFGMGRKGLLQAKAPAGEGEWTVTRQAEMPSLSNVLWATSMVWHDQYGVLARNHGYDLNFNPENGNYYNYPDVLSAYKGMDWKSMSTTYRSPSPALTIDNPEGISVDPKNRDHVYCGSARSGMMRLDLKEPSKSLHFTKADDFNGGRGETGFVEILPANPAGTWAEACVFSQPCFDSDGNLWALYNDQATGGELWVWTPEKRLATTSSANFKPWTKKKLDFTKISNQPELFVPTTAANKNIVIIYGNHNNSEMIILDTKGTPENFNDDKRVSMKTLYDQDGTSIPFYRVSCWYEDPSTGTVWVGYDNGLFTFSPQEAFSSPNSVRRIKVARNDGTNLADYLLDGIRVNAITSDPSGRKWFATTGAGLVCTSADGRSILESHTTDNSQIAGNTVYAVCYNPENNSMMAATDGGICELFMRGSSAGSGNEARAYPNPVRPDYFGSVTIDGIATDAAVKIVDSAGQLVKECGFAVNGEAVWDVTNIFHKRVPAGVYYVIATNGPDSESYNEVAKVLVVN